MTIDFDTLRIGESLPQLQKGPITRTQLALFAGASGDHNPIHLDDEEARAGGLPGVIAHGMLNMAFLGQFLTGWSPQHMLRAFEARFSAMAFPGDTITCRGKVAEKREVEGERLLDLDLVAENQKGETILAGRATLVLT